MKIGEVTRCGLVWVLRLYFHGTKGFAEHRIKTGERVRMEVNQLRYLVAVAKAGSFSKAARECYVSQPALSEQIQKLEQEIGKPLFNRNRRVILPTPAGRVLIEQATRILEHVETAKHAARTCDGVIGGKINLGVLPTIAPYFLPHV